MIRGRIRQLLGGSPLSRVLTKASLLPLWGFAEILFCLECPLWYASCIAIQSCLVVVGFRYPTSPSVRKQFIGDFRQNPLCHSLLLRLQAITC